MEKVITKQDIIDLIRNHYDPVPAHWRASESSSWNDGTGEIADAILARLSRPVAEDDARDAARWRALMASARMHFMGSANFVHEPPPDDPTCRETQRLTPTCPPGARLHFGMEFWSDHPPSPEYPDVFERKMMEAYADEMVRRLAAAAPRE